MPKRIMKTSALRKMELVKLTDLARVAGLKYSTLLHYKTLNLLPYVIPTGKNVKYFPLKDSLKRIKKILSWKKKGIKLKSNMY